MRTACLIVNPIALARRAAGKIPSVIATLKNAGWHVTVCETTAEQLSTDLARSAVSSGCEVVIAAGGDGTVSAVAAGLLHSSAHLGILPMGTFNNIAHGLGIPLDLFRALDTILHGTPRPMDVGLANNVPFLEAAGVGLDASLLPLGEDIKSGRYERLLEAGYAFFRQTPVEMLVILDQQEMTVRTPVVVIANGPYYGAGFSVVPEATMRDGLLEVAVFECGVVEMARQYALSAQNRPHREACVSVYRAREVRVIPSTPVPAHADGKPLGKVPLICRVLQGALRVIATGT